MSVKKLAIFDLDGTLNDVVKYAVKAFQTALKDLEIKQKLCDEQISNMFGAPWDKISKTLLPELSEEKIKKLDVLVDKYENEFMDQEGTAFPGAIESLEILRKKGYITAICSNSKIEYINRVLKIIQIDELIDYKQGLHDGCKKDDMVKLLLDNIKPDRAVMVGDRIYDMDAARTNNIPFVGCLYGCVPVEMDNADIKINTAYEISDAVISIVEK